jgi:hypothetical protein
VDRDLKFILIRLLIQSTDFLENHCGLDRINTEMRSSLRRSRSETCVDAIVDRNE